MSFCSLILWLLLEICAKPLHALVGKRANGSGTFVESLGYLLDRPVQVEAQADDRSLRRR
jgi:hypothetical protein